MPTMENGDVRIRYEEHGSGFPLLLLAPGGLGGSVVDAWSNAPWNPVEAHAGDFRVIAMDQRHCGGSTAPVTGDDGWGSYASDQIALLDHLGVEKALAMGMCIGGTFIATLLTTAPDRFVGAVMLQPTGRDGNEELFRTNFDKFAADRRDEHPEASDADWSAFKENLYDNENTLFSVPDTELTAVETPLLVLCGGDEPHPESASRTLVQLAQDATLIERWKTGEHVEPARANVEDFLALHRPT